MASELEKLRPIGRLERYSTARHHLGFYNNVALTVYYSTGSPVALKEEVFSALAALIRIHPILSAVPVDEHCHEPYFARLPEINLDECVLFRQRQQPHDDGLVDEELDELLAAQHNDPFKITGSQRPFWRLVILTHPAAENKFAASFVYHHAIGDGLSGKAFHKSFRRCLSDPITNIDGGVVKSIDGPLLPELDKLHALPVSFLGVVKALYNDAFAKAPRTLWSGGFISTPLLSRFRSSTFSPVIAQNFSMACRRENATVTSTIESLAAAALFKFIPEQYSELKCQLAISFRRWVSPPITEDSMGVWVIALDEQYHRQPFSWDEARRSKRTITEFLAHNGNKGELGLLRWVSDYHKHFRSKIGRPRTSSFEISNIGIWQNSEQECKWNIGRTVFSQCASVTGCAIEICIVGGGDGSLTIGYAWQEGIVDNELIFQMMNEMNEQITLLSKASG